MAWTADDLATAQAALIRAITTGKRVRFGDREYESPDVNDLRELIAEMERVIGATTQTGHAYRLAATSKGL
jgi:hypothetical protein